MGWRTSRYGPDRTSSWVESTEASIRRCRPRARAAVDWKSTRLNSSHLVISYAGFCLKKTRRATCGRRTTSAGPDPGRPPAPAPRSREATREHRAERRRGDRRRPARPCGFLFNDTATTEIYTLSLHDALPISPRRARLTDAESGRHATVPVLQ